MFISNIKFLRFLNIHLQVGIERSRYRILIITSTALQQLYAHVHSTV